MAKAVLATGDLLVATARRDKCRDDTLNVALDVTDEDQAHGTVRAVLGRFSRIDVLVNNAGLGPYGGMRRPARPRSSVCFGPTYSVF